VITAIYMQDTVTWVRSGGTDAFGEPLGDTETVVKCRLDLTTRLVRDISGNEVAASGPILFPYQPAAADKLIIDSVERPIVAVSAKKSLGAIGHWEVYVA